MWADLGRAALWAALPLSIWGIGAAAAAAAHRDGRALASARLATAAAFVLSLVACGAMIGALVSHDFSIAYVARNNARETPLFFTVISLWAALEGSILLWTAILAGAAAYVAWFGTRTLPRLATVALALLLAMLAFFLLLLVTPAADPFVRLELVPENGRGPNPLLQNHPLMALHPPLLYLGYVLTSIPFAYGMAALILGEGGDRWLVATRRAALTAWSLLGLGIVAGAWWGYAVLGWGGYWAWDPVENAALMPWLTATAYLHSVMVEERRHILRVWNLTLVTATFALTIFGTFLTRSGVVNSVHSFTQSAIGPLLLGYLVVILAFATGLLVWRGVRLRDAGGISTPFSREAIFLFQNVVFVALTLTVLLGTMYPLIAEALSNTQLSIGAPYFNRVGIPLGLALLFLMGVGPQLPWHGASRSTLERQFTVPAAAAALGALLALAVGLREVAGVLSLALAGFVSATVVQEFVRGVRARRVLHQESAGPALVGLLRRNGRRYGGYVVHIGIVVAAVAITISQLQTVEVERTLSRGGSMAAGPFELQLRNVREVVEPQRRQLVAEVSASGVQSVVVPALTFYPNATQAIGTPAIVPGLDRDLFIVLVAYDTRDLSWVTLRVRVVPLVSWLWISALIVGGGTLIAAWPSLGTRRARITSVSSRSPAA